MSTLSWSHPFWATLIYDRLTLKITDEIPTLGVDGHYLYVNEKYFTEECDDMEQIFALAHEVGHCMWFHPQRWMTYLKNGFDGESFDPHRANIAGDLIINAMLVHMGVGRIKRHDPPQPGDWLLSPNVHWTDSFEDVYRRTKPQQQGGGGGGSGDPQSGASGGDSGNPQSGPNGGDQMPNGSGGFVIEPHPERGGSPDTITAPKSQDTHIANDSTVSEIEWKQSVEAAAMGAKAIGKFHQDMQAMVDGYVEVKRDWKQELRDYFVRHKGRDRRDWRRANKRKMHQFHTFVPKRNSWKVGNVLIVDDWSGSVSSDERDWFKGTMSAILTDCVPKELRVMGTTTRVCKDEVLKTPADLDNWHREGTGGTDMEAAFRVALDDGYLPDVCVVLTDGYTPFTHEPPFPVIWVSTQKRVEDFPYGRAVKME